jgi:iron complex outermembrane receptor protein
MTSKFLATASIGAAIAFFAAAAAGAQTPAPAAASETAAVTPDAGLDEIVVTARRRSENAQNVPISLTSLSGDELLNRNVVRVSDIGRFAPNLFIGTGGSAVGGLVIGIRGQLQTDQITTLDPSVGIYVDGVYWARAQGANTNIVDLRSAEVLKGPQGTLFGRNTTGGALVLTTNNPNLNDVEGMVQGRVANFGQLDAAGVINIPIVSDKLAIRIAGQRIHNDGFQTNLTTGNSLGSDNSYSIRAKVLFQPTDNLRILAQYEHLDIDQKAPISRLLYTSPGSAAEVVARVESGGTRTFNQYVNQGTFYAAFLNFEGNPKAHTNTASLTAELDLGVGTLKYIGAYRNTVSLSDVYDYDGSPFTILHPSNNSRSAQWSHEVTLSGSLFDDKFDYTGGAFLFRESGTDGGSTVSLPAINPNNPNNTAGEMATNSWAVFGQGTYRFSDVFSFTGGLRYSEDKKSLDLRSTTRGNCSLRVGNPPVFIPATQPCLVSQERTDSAVIYLASFEFKLAEDVLAYAKVNNGYRSGGFNLRGTTPSTYAAFLPETVVNYEGGVKSEFWDRRVRFNVAGFYNTYSDIQRGVLVSNGVGGVATTTINAAKANIYGLEADITARVTDSLTLSGTLGITKPSYDTFLSTCPTPFPTTSLTPCINGNFDRAAEKFERIPEINWTLAADYRHAVPLGTALFHIDYAYIGDTINQGVTQTLTPALVPFVSQSGYGLLNARIAWNIEKPDIQVAVFGRNLTGKDFYAYQLDLVNAGLGYIFYNPGTPRQYGIEATFRF